jgi:hypothetical protein
LGCHHSGCFELLDLFPSPTFADSSSLIQDLSYLMVCHFVLWGAEEKTHELETMPVLQELGSISSFLLLGLEKN